jgi:asparagine synthetase B (glutamine-hydrolysing)
MCGLVGFLGFSREDSLPPWQVLQAMTDAIVHRGPDSEGHWLDPAAQIALGLGVYPSSICRPLARNLCIRLPGDT